MELDEKTQAFVDGLIKKKYAEAHSKAEAKAAEQLAAAEAKHAEEVSSLKSENEKLKGKEAENNERVRKALLKAEVSLLNAVNTEQVVKLIGDNIVTAEDGTLAVVDSEGKTRFTAEGKPLTVKEFVDEYLDANPHLKQALRSAGAGSTSSIFFTGMVAANTAMRRTEFNNLSAKQKTDYLQSGGKLRD